MYFTRVTENQEDLYYAIKDQDGNWGEAIFMKEINTYENEGAHCISADGKTILFTACSDGRNGQPRGCNIYISTLKLGQWSKPEYFKALNSKAWDAQPNISADGRIIVFASRRAGGQGKSDLWWMSKNGEDVWTSPANMGNVINTKGNEESPFLHPDGKTLYFKSDNHLGFGSFDLFVSRVVENGEWGVPENIGYPLNSSDHEGALVVSLDGVKAYFSRGNGATKFDKRQSDIYQFDLPLKSRPNPVGFVKIKVLDSDSGAPLTTMVEIQKKNNTILSKRSYETDGLGEILITMEAGYDFSLNISKEGYQFYSDRFEMTVNEAIITQEIEVPLHKLIIEAENEPIVLKNVLFEIGSSILLEESVFELDKLMMLMTDNVKINIEIRGHTDNVGEEEANLILSEERAKAVYEYLIQNGIDSSRLDYKGFGESLPIADNETTLGRKQNRRTEFQIKN
jgi:outer membrane protein OmpA-like peptidoglycan-associated protein